MPESVSTRSAYKMLTCIYLCRTLLFFAPYADFLEKNFRNIEKFLVKYQHIFSKTSAYFRREVRILFISRFIAVKKAVVTT